MKVIFYQKKLLHEKNGIHVCEENEKIIYKVQSCPFFLKKNATM